MKPWKHAQASVRRYGGQIGDYLDIHEFLDQSKAAHPDMRHRAMLHHSFGPFIAAQVFGEIRENSDGRTYDVRQVCEDHIIEDMGTLPSLSYFMNLIPESEIDKFAYKKQHQRRAD